eukprot:3968650-Amphidinium_carterae.1
MVHSWTHPGGQGKWKAVASVLQMKLSSASARFHVAQSKVPHCPFFLHILGGEPSLQSGSRHKTFVLPPSFQQHYECRVVFGQRSDELPFSSLELDKTQAQLSLSLRKMSSCLQLVIGSKSNGAATH